MESLALVLLQRTEKITFHRYSGEILAAFDKYHLQ